MLIEEADYFHTITRDDWFTPEVINPPREKTVKSKK